MSVTKRTRIENGRKVAHYQAEVYVDGVRVAYRSFETKAAAHAWHDAEKARVKRGTRKPSLTFGEVFDRYLTEQVPKWRMSTQESFRGRVPYFTESPLHGVKMEDFTDRSVDGWVDWLLEHQSASNSQRKSFNNELNILAVVLNWWRDYHDPTFAVPVCKRHRDRVRFKKVPPRRRDYYIRHEDVLPWLNWLRDNLADPVYFRAAYFQILTGLRVSEVAGLNWDSVDLRGKFVSIRRVAVWSRNGRGVVLEDATKTNQSNRIVRLCPELVQLLTEMGGVSGPVFAHLDGRILDYGLVKYYYTRGFKKLGLPWTATHILRHSWATLGLLANRGNLTAIQSALGHSSRQTTERYAKVVAMIEDGTADQVSALIHGGNHGSEGAKLKLLNNAEG